MTAEERKALPAPQSLGDDPVLSAGMGIAARWGEVLGPEKLQIALRALEPQLKREHQALMKRLEMAQEEAVQLSREKSEERKHKRHLADLAAGTVIAVAMLGAGVYVAAGTWWLAALLCGPSLLALTKVFVLRRSEPGDMRYLSQLAGSLSRTDGRAGRQPSQPPNTE